MQAAIKALFGNLLCFGNAIDLRPPARGFGGGDLLAAAASGALGFG
jgi:hypothetical protein